MKKIISMLAIPGLFFVANANGQNLITNGGFDTDTSSWSGVVEFQDAIADESGSGGYNRLFIPNIDYSGGSSFFVITQSSNVTIQAGDITNFGFAATTEPFGKDASNQLDIYMKVLFYDGVDQTGNNFLTEEIIIDLASNPLIAESWSTFDLTTAALSSTAQSIKVELFAIASEDMIGVGDNTFLAFDSVSLTAVPEPSTYAMIAGFLAFGFVAVRRRMAAK